MRVRVSDHATVSELERHLAEQGFPASRQADGELEVLFPGAPTIFESAVELDLWRSRHDGVTVSVVTAAELV